MSRRRKKERKPDPDRENRIREMLENEKELARLFESTNKLGRDLLHRAHYDKVWNERTATILALLPEIKELHESCVDLRAKCILAEMHLKQKCNSAQEELDRFRGRTQESNRIDPLLATLPPRQANAIRVVIELNRVQASKISLADINDLVERFTEVLESVERKTIACQDAAKDLLELSEIIIERGWETTTDLKALKPSLENCLKESPEIPVNHRKFLSDWLQRCQTLALRTENLYKGIGFLQGKN